MIEYENLIYLDVYRTGSTHIIKLLENIVDEKLTRSHRHAALTRGRRHGLTGGKLVFTTVRNPWDWYVSLWAHGVDGKSAIRKYLSQHIDSNELKELYDRATPVDAFRRWIKTIHNPGILDLIMREHYPQSGLSYIIGLYTYRFLRVTTRYPRIFLRRLCLKNSDGVVSFHRKRKAYSRVLRNETLTRDLIKLVTDNSLKCRFKPEARLLIEAASNQRHNAGIRPLAGYRAYYDRESIELVEIRDRFFSDEFGYTF